MDIFDRLIPTPSRIDKKKGELKISRAIISYDELYENEAQHLYSFLDETFEVYFDYELSMIDEIYDNEWFFIRFNNVDSLNLREQAYELEIIGDQTVIVEQSSGVSIVCKGMIKIDASTQAGAFYAVQTLKQMLKLAKIQTFRENIDDDDYRDQSHIDVISIDMLSNQDENSLKKITAMYTFDDEDFYQDEEFYLPNCLIFDKPCIKTRGYYFDVTRGKVPTLEYLMEIVDVLAEYKYNQLQLYVEHTYAFSKFTEIWRDADPLTKEEILELDEYCTERHIELVPSLSSFGHLYTLLTSKRFKHLSEMPEEMMQPYNLIDRMSQHTIDVMNDESIEVIKALIDEYSSLFTSKKFNICCDETFDLGMYKNKELADKVGKSTLYINFLLKIIEHVKSKGLIVMCWADILNMNVDLIDMLPKDVILLNWGYGDKESNEFILLAREKMFRQYVCPGVNGWNRFIHDYEMGFKNIHLMTKYAHDIGTAPILLTDWGDMGNINNFTLSIPLVMYQADIAWNDAAIKDMNENVMKKYLNLFTFERFCDFDGVVVDDLFQASKLTKFILKDIHGHFLLQNTGYQHAWHYEKSYCELYTKEEISNATLKLEQILSHLEAYFDNMELYDMDEYDYDDVADLVTAVKGTILFNKYFLFRHLKDEYSSEYRIELARDLDLFANEFKQTWRNRNKESQLKDITNLMFEMADEIRLD